MLPRFVYLFARAHSRLVIVAESVAILQIGVALVVQQTNLEWSGIYDGALSQSRRQARCPLVALRKCCPPARTARAPPLSPC